MKINPMIFDIEYEKDRIFRKMYLFIDGII